MVHIVNDGGQVVAGRSADNNLLCTGVDVSLCLFLAGVEAGAFQHYIHADLAPGAVVGIGESIDLDLLAVHNNGILSGFHSVLVLTDLAQERALSGIVLEQVCQHCRAGQVVDGHNIIALGLEHLAESQAANTAKTIDCYFNRHNFASQIIKS